MSNNNEKKEANFHFNTIHNSELLIMKTVLFMKKSKKESDEILIKLNLCLERWNLLGLKSELDRSMYRDLGKSVNVLNRIIKEIERI